MDLAPSLPANGTDSWAGAAPDAMILKFRAGRGAL